MTDAPEDQPIKPDRLLVTLEQLLAIDATELEPALRSAADIVSRVLGAEKADVFLYEASSETLVARGTSDTPLGRKQRDIGMDRLPLAGAGRAAEVFRSGRSHRTGHADEDPCELIGIVQGLGVRSEVTVALNVGPEPRGVLCVVSTQPDAFSETDQHFLEAVARWTSLVLHRSELTQAYLGKAEERGRRAGLEASLAHLTPRQREIAILIANGYSNQQIAQRLVLTQGTVANHVAQTLDRLGVESRTQVATLVAELGLHRRNGEPIDA